MKLTYNSSPAVVQFYLKKAKMTQFEASQILDVSANAISKAVKNEKGMSSLREKLVDLISGKIQRVA